MENKVINVVLTADSNYTEVVSVAMFSVLYNLSEHIFTNFYVFSSGFSSKGIKKLKVLEKKFPCKIHNIPVDKYLPLFSFVSMNNFKNKWISMACYYRLLLFKYLPEDVKECFYIDSDIIVDCDLSKIHLDGDKIFAATIEACAMQDRREILQHCYKIEEFKNFAYDSLKYPYFNAGFFLVNLSKSKELHIFEQLMDLLKKYPALPYSDQDLLNIIFGQKYFNLIQFLPPEYNVFSDINYKRNYDNIPFSNEQLQIAVKNPKVYHFAGALKPWLGLKPLHFYNKWWEYLYKSPYKFSSKYSRKRLLLWLFSVRNLGIHKIICVFGIKLKFKSKKLIER